MLVGGVLWRALVALLPCRFLLGANLNAVALALLVGLFWALRARMSARENLRCIRCGWALRKTWGRCCPQCKLKVEHSERAVFADIAEDRCTVCGATLATIGLRYCRECAPFFQRIAGPRSAGALYCETCGFDLRGCTKNRCPECNTTFVRRLPRRYG